ncbi:PREDICTED: coiled-coil domain-containing protein 18-like isoform X2 [Camelina sativa]|uniref:Coiled-coil domain-containing protein 18-like isoform X2 n=1 Tax=Camelina sativa TaxID=90675 RepID=A0ABM0TX75_CAMSA|nr:PREDICTED: coiled-coil domain-containing protein 18-like isoform X2 [Camelina sativa]
MIFYCSTRVNLQKQKSLVACPSSRRVKRHSLLSVQSVLNNTRPNTNENRTDESANVLVEKLLARTQSLERQTNQHSVYPDDDLLPYSNLGVLEPDLEAALVALLKREEDLQDAERKLLSEKKKLNRAKEELEKREKVIGQASLKHESLQEELKRANAELALQAKEIEELKHKLRDRDEERAALQSSLTLKEGELDQMREEVANRSKEVSVDISEYESKSRLLSKANEVVKRQECEILALQRSLEDREEELEISKATKKLEQEKLSETEANLKMQAEEWLIAQDEVNKLKEETVKRLGEANETMEDFRRVKKLLTDVRFELVSSREALVSSREQMEEKEQVLEKEVDEVEEQRKSVMSYMQSLRDAHTEVESERVKLRVAEAKNFVLERELSGQKDLLEELREQLQKEKPLLEQAMHDISVIQDELYKKANAFQVSQNLLQEKESSLVEAKLEIQHLKSEQASLELLLQEKDEELTEARHKLEEVNREVTQLKALMTRRDDQLMQATAMLKEKDVHLHRIEDELGSSKLKVTEAEMVVERIAELTSRLLMSTTNGQNQNTVRVNNEISFDSMQQPLPLESDYGTENKRLVMELNFTRESLRMKEMEVLAVQRALTFKDEEINVFMGRLEAKERELKKLKEETTNDSEDLKNLYALAQERIGGKTMGDLAIEKLQLEAAQLEVEAATSALQKLAEMSTELLTQADMSIEAEPTVIVMPANGFQQGKYSEGSNECLAEVKTEVGKLWSLTEKLLENAGIVAGRSTGTKGVTL